MNKKEIFGRLSRMNCTNEQKNIIGAIEEAKEEMKRAREYFELVNESKLIDYAIYMEEAAKAKYIFLLSEAKRKGIKVNCSYILEEDDAV